LTQTVSLNDTTVKFEIWDTAGRVIRAYCLSVFFFVFFFCFVFFFLASGMNPFSIFFFSRTFLNVVWLFFAPAAVFWIFFSICNLRGVRGQYLSWVDMVYKMGFFLFSLFSSVGKGISTAKKKKKERKRIKPKYALKPHHFPRDKNAYLPKTTPKLRKCALNRVKTAAKPVNLSASAGQERYHSLAPMYYRGAAAAIVVFDITNMDSFNRACSLSIFYFFICYTH
jgi:hypothetical protein